MRTNVEQLQRERNNLSAQLATVQEELSDRENQLKTLEQECVRDQFLHATTVCSIWMWWKMHLSLIFIPPLVIHLR